MESGRSLSEQQQIRNLAKELVIEVANYWAKSIGIQESDIQWQNLLFKVKREYIKSYSLYKNNIYEIQIYTLWNADIFGFLLGW